MSSRVPKRPRDMRTRRPRPSRVPRAVPIVAAARRRSGRGPMYTRGVGNFASGPNTTVMNRGPEYSYYSTRKSLIGMQIYPGIGAAAAAAWQFDPGWIVPNGFGYVNFQTGPIPDWAPLVLLFDNYRIKKVKVTASIKLTNGSQPARGEEIYMRFMDDSVLPVSTGMASLSNVTRHVFTPDSPSVEYSFVPKAFMDMTGGQASQTAVDFPWVDTDQPVAGYGMLFNCPYLPVGTSLQFDLEYDLEFRFDN